MTPGNFGAAGVVQASNGSSRAASTIVMLAALTASCCFAQLVKVAPYYTPGVGTQSLTSNATSDTSIIMLASGSMVRTLIPFSGPVYAFSVYLADSTNLTDLYFFKSTCTSMAANACTVFTNTYTAQITGPFTPNAVNTFTLATPLAVSKWDAEGVQLDWSTPHATNLAALSAQLIPAVTGNGDSTLPEACYSQLNISKPATLTLSAMTLIPNAGCIPVGIYMAPPYLSGIGDSIMGSAPAPSDSVADALAQDYPIPSTYSPVHFWAGNFPVVPTYQSMGWSGQTCVQVQTRFTTDAANLGPTLLLIECGINDINGCNAGTGCTGPQITAIETAIDSMMAAAQTAGLKTFVMLAGPDSASQSGSNARMLSEDTVNANTIAMAPGYGATVVDWRCLLGQFRAGGSAGNCWDWQTAYEYMDGLGVHPNQAGVQLIGNLIYSLAPVSNFTGGNTFIGGTALIGMIPVSPALSWTGNLTDAEWTGTLTDAQWTGSITN